MAIYKSIIITQEFLDQNPNSYFVFGDNLERNGTGGAAKLRYHPQSIGFITKKFPDNKDESFYKPEEYAAVFFEELDKLKKNIKARRNDVFYISQLGGGLANKYYIWQKIIEHNLTSSLNGFKNVIYCWSN